MSPSISLLIVNYNRDRYLSAAIESVITQTNAEFELLIWDDGSTDRSLEIANHYARQDQRIRVVAAAHQGIALARQAAIAQTTGEYLGWVDSDDRLASTALAETVAVLSANPDIGMVYTNHLIVDAEDTVKGLGQRCLVPYSKEVLLLCFMTFHFRLMRRSVFEQVGGINPACAYAYDYDLCLRLSEMTSIQHIPKPLYFYRCHSEAISYQKQQLQIRDSYQAISEALQRRGLSDRYEVQFEQGYHHLQRKKKSA